MKVFLRMVMDYTPGHIARAHDNDDQDLQTVIEAKPQKAYQAYCQYDY
jgi:hypothetical protein